MWGIEGLEDGTKYYVQVWLRDARSAGEGRWLTLGDNHGEEPGDESTVSIDAWSGDFSETEDNLGQHAIGRFTADGSTQDVSFLMEGNEDRPHANAVMVRVVPEPGSLALLGAGAGLLMLRRRR